MLEGSSVGKVAVIRLGYLPTSETFIYNELINLKKHKPIVFTKSIKNLKKFPFKHIHKFSKYRKLRMMMKKQKVDLIHARFGTTGAKLLGVKRKMGLPLLTSFHGCDVPSNRKSRQKYGDKLGRLFKEGDAFTVTSNDMRDILMKYGCSKDKIYVHHSGIDVDRFKFKKRELPKNKKIKFLSVGRLVEKKGMEYLISAFKEVLKEYPKAKLRIVGEGSLRRKLKVKVRKLNLKGKVEFLGELSHSQVAKEMNNAHIFVLASTTSKSGNQEGIPNAIKEAMASGLPVVSTKHAGIPELVNDGSSGFLVPERNSKELANRLLDIIKKHKKWGNMGREGRDIVMESFNMKKQITNLEDIYSKLISRNKK